MTGKQALAFYVDALRPQRNLLIVGLSLVGIEALMLTPIPKAVGYIVDQVHKNNFVWMEQHLPHILLAMLGYLLVFMPLAYCRSVYLGRVSMRVFFTLRVRLWKHLQGLSAEFFSRSQTGDLTSRIVSDIQTASTTIVGVLQRILWDIFTLIPVLFMMFYTNWQLSLFVVTHAGIQLYFIRRMLPKIRAQSKAIANKLGEISTEATEKLEGMTLVRAFAREDEVIQRFENLNRDHLTLSDRLLRYSTRRQIMIKTPGDLFLNVLIALFGMFLARRGFITAGDIVAIILYAPMVSSPLSRLADAMTQWAQAIGSISRINEVFSSFPSVVETPDAVVLPRGEGRVSIRDIHFTYPPMASANQPLKTIDGFSLEIEPGQVVALVGHSGSGKSTMAQLLLRFYDADSGSILIDGHDVREVSLASLRNNIGIVMQRSIIFRGTIYDNLRFVKPDATEEEAFAALRFAALAEYIERLPEGIHTVLGEGGVNLSGGQQQRLSIARTFLRDPSILILDEATSSLDARSEQQIQQELERLMQGRTTLVIAHRLSTIYNAHRIVVLQEGRIVESGTHQQLMNRRGAYYELVSTQAHAAEPMEHLLEDKISSDDSGDYV